MMKYFTILLVAILFFTSPMAHAQYASVNFDLEKNYFNEGQPLPSERNLMFTGIIPQGVSRIEIDIYAGKKVDYSAIWKKAFVKENTNNFNLAVNYKLRASDQYDFSVRFFQNMTYEQVNELKKHLVEQASGYLVAGIQLNGQTAKLADKANKMIRKADEIMEAGLVGYRRSDDVFFSGFSNAILQQLEAYDGVRVDSNVLANTVQKAIYDKVKVEVEQYISGSWTKLLFSRFIDDYETEKKQRSLSVNAGYGGIHLSGELDDFSYADAPYVGILLPISSSVRAPKFFQNTSLNLGVFLSQIGQIEDRSYSGFIIDQPLFVGLNFKLFQFIGLDAGTTFLEESRIDGLPGGDNRNFLIRPFIGLSARFDLSIGLGK